VETLGELERSVMDQLWAAEDGLTAAEIRESFADRDLALTTVHTVLSRLEKKKFVTRRRGERPHRYRAASSREEHVAELMSDALGQAPDREAVLARFLGTVDKEDTALLRRLLGSS
jgi:predicted transcriptional regulator